jgi:YHS domain-containing protein
MNFLNQTLQAVVLMVCDKHAPLLLEKLQECPEGNWFVMPSIAGCRTGYHPHVSPAHAGQGCAVFGFVEQRGLAQRLREFASLNPDGSLCPDCMAYQWSVTPMPIGETGRDPVCGRVVTSAGAISRYHNGELFLFCGIHCRDAFMQAPHDYLAPRSEIRQSTPEPVVAAGSHD